MPYIIQRNDGAYVSRSGSAASYTRVLEHARIYQTREQAEQDKCGNESIVSTAQVWPR